MKPTIKNADNIMSKYVRKRDAILTTWWEDYIRCISCWQVKEFKCFDAWHFQPRQHKATRWQEQNVNAQCKRCNNKNWGWWEQYKHWLGIDKKYWKWTADTLVKLAKEIQKINTSYLAWIIEEYQEKLNNLKFN